MAGRRLRRRFDPPRGCPYTHAMTVHFDIYTELPAPLPLIAELCAAQPPIDAEPLGSFWLWQGDLWRFRVSSFADNHFVWVGEAPALRPARQGRRHHGSSRLVLSIALSGTAVSTHARIHLTLEPTGSRLSRLLADVRARRSLRRSLEQGLAALRASAVELTPAPTAPTNLPADEQSLAQVLRPTHPFTVAAFEQMHALDKLAAVARLEQRWRDVENGVVDNDMYHQVATLPEVDRQFDLLYAGGGLGLLHAALMAQRYGYRILVFDRAEIGTAHREWNISDAELRALVDSGFASRPEIESVVMRRYEHGIVSFRADGSAVRPAELRLPGVLNVALDAAALLRLARSKLEQAGGIVLDRRSLRRVFVAGAGAVAAELEAPDGVECYGGRLLVDGLGSTSPLALRRFAGQPFAGICPTVGSVVSGLEHGTAPDQHNPDVGDVLVSVADAQRGRQLIWEGFAGRDDELTVYVFYYDVLRPSSPHPRSRAKARERGWEGEGQAHHSLLDLFEDYFQLLPTYKRPGPTFRHLRPVYGYIPARHTQRRHSMSLLPGVLPMGDSSAQQSPLTFTGFGSHVRNLERTASLLDWALRRDLLAPDQLAWISAYQSNVALNWVFSRFMQPWGNPSDVNRLQNVFARVLNELGEDVAVRFFRDRMSWRDYGRIVNHTLEVYRGIIPTALRVLGARDTARWVVDWLRFSVAAALAAVGRIAGARLLDTIEQRLEHARPELALRFKALRAEWSVMGWAGGQPVETAPIASAGVAIVDPEQVPLP